MAKNTAGLKRDAGPGRPKGSKNKVPGSVKASFRKVCEDIGAEQPDLIRKAFERGLTARPPHSFSYLQVWAHYTDGKPKDTIEVRQRGKLIEVVLAGTPTPPDDSGKSGSGQ